MVGQEDGQMRAKSLLVAGCLGMLISTYALSNTSLAGCTNSFSYDTYSCASGCATSCTWCDAVGGCAGSSSPCQCTDYGYSLNDCISKTEYCEAFGNVGGR